MIATIKDELKMHRKLEADGYYSKALSLNNFGNYTGAVDFLTKAKGMYQELGYFNESVQCDIQVIKIADKHYRTALTAFQSRDFLKAVTFAETARDLYAKAGSFNASFNAAELAREANLSIGKTGPKTEPEADYTVYLVGAIVLMLAAIAYMALQSKGRRKGPAEAEADEELEGLDEGVK
jgi:hypothetical protein